ncbi:TetR family transcriptional regulator [Allobranchiibius huperziae]|uniref:AcrR family transcriptional regulator n=1 Tax=Allobranchiibius huperziae TaxID=1874116 RepID=A0A853DA46_9MICO|nr:AcrR family transcriptional regulator [Allobranchiibius huperziae]
MTTQAARVGRPRSEEARTAVLHAVDDLLVEVGYAAMTMKGIAERAGVGRQTVYRWWSTKAEILLEAAAADAREELAVTISGDLRTDLRRYLDQLMRFLTTSVAGAAYRALLGEAQHDRAVAELVAADDVLFETACTVLRSAPSSRASRSEERAAAAILTGPVVLWVLTGQDPDELTLLDVVDALTSLTGA